MMSLHDYILDSVGESAEFVRVAQDPTKGHFENGKPVNWDWGREPTPEERIAIEEDVEFELKAAQTALKKADEAPLTEEEIKYFRETERAYRIYIGDLPKFVAKQKERRNRLNRSETFGMLVDERVEGIRSGWDRTNGQRPNIAQVSLFKARQASR